MFIWLLLKGERICSRHIWQVLLKKYPLDPDTSYSSFGICKADSDQATSQGPLPWDKILTIDLCGRSLLACHMTTALTIYLMIPFVSEVCWLISNRCEEKISIHVLIQVWFRKYCLGKLPKCNQTLSVFLSWELFDNMFYSFNSTSSLKGRSS